MNKILYRFIDGHHKFYGLVKEIHCGGKGFCCAQERCRWLVQRENAPEIINPEAFLDESMIGSEINMWYKDNDIFDLPESLEFKEDSIITSKWNEGDGLKPISTTRALRIVKAETEEEPIEKIIERWGKETEKEPEEEGWEKHWEEVNQQLSSYNGGGVNPHAYRLGFLKAQSIQRKKT